MAQKNKVKELVGRGLNSYHTKALQQVDRIEKKNKEQNHKISILSNELDNDYLTKTEEGSVISLEHSKEGMVYLDELQGNTLVNYCTDGSKEMTLNGDIDVEGTFVTTTEGVDNGKVDVMCEGNTLVNLIQGVKAKSNSAWITVNDKVTFENPTGAGHVEFKIMLKPSTKYTVITRILQNSLTQVRWDLFPDNFEEFPAINNKTGVITHTFTTPSDITSLGSFRYYYPTNETGKVVFEMPIILEGDWTNRELPTSYFEGMKSVGQDDVNGHKIEILSSNGKPNLFRNSGFLNGLNGFNFHNHSRGTIIEDATSGSGKILQVVAGEKNNSGFYQTNIVPYVENVRYTLSCYCKGDINAILDFNIEGHKATRVTFKNNDWVKVELTSELNPTSWNRTITFYSQTSNSTFYIKDMKVEVSDYATPYVPHITETNYNTFKRLNKKEILINEPLRALPNGTKDKIIKIGNKPFIERNVGKHILNGSEYWDIHTGDWVLDNSIVFSTTFPNAKGYVWETYKGTESMSDKIPSYADDVLRTTDVLGYTNDNTGGAKRFRLPKSYLSSEDAEGCKQWFSNNNVEVIYELATPTYEPLEIEPTLNTYNDVTHISNNSLIPCNMKIKNSGYNAIIKPSTLYTVALDTDKAGTIGMNLGGAKTTTANNIATVTTPATLTDDSLRLFGKGIKGSKVRLLEGDKTNWIPSHFEGMKSSFEDKVQSDGSYKMEILSNNENLFDDSQFEGIKTVNINGYECYDYRDIRGQWLKLKKPFMVKKGQRYYLTSKVIRKYADGADTTQRQYIGFSLEPNKGGYGHPDALFFVSGNDNSQNTIQNDVVSAEAKNSVMLTDLSIVNYGDIDNRCIYLVKDSLMLKTVNSFEEYITHKSNKIQFLLDEPLRSLPNNVRDEITFKDNKLMIERNIGVKRLTSEDVTGYGATNSSNSNTKPNVKIIQFRLQNLKPSWGGLTTLCNKLKTGKIGKGDQTSIEHLYWGTEYNWIGCNNTSEPYVGMTIDKTLLSSDNIAGARQYIDNENIELIYQLAEPTYEEVPHELQKIILEGYENGTLFFDTNIPPTSTVRYAGETPIVKATKLNKTEVLNNTEDINDNIIPYLMDMDYRVVMLQLATEELEGGVSMARLFGGTYEMIKRDILSKRLTREEYGYRLADYFNAGKLTEEQVRELEELR